MLTMPGEVELARLAGVTLTSHRVQFEVNRWGEQKLTTVTLDDLTSCDIESRSKPFHAIGLGVLIAIDALLFSSIAVALAGVLIGLAVWFFSRHKIMVLRSASEKIEVSRPYGQWKELQEFIHQIQTVKADRMTASRASSLAAVLGSGRQEAALPVAGEPMTPPLRPPGQSVALNSQPFTKAAEQKAESARPSAMWTGSSSSFTFGVRVGSSSTASAPARTRPETPPATAAPEVAPVAVETRHADREVSSENLVSELQHRKTHRTAALVASIGITAGIVFAVVFAAMWFSTSPRNASQGVPSEPSRNRELSGTAILNLAAPGVVSIEAFDEAGLKKGSGAGFVADGTTIITNYRVIRGSSAAKVRFANGDIADVLGVLGHDVALNVALLRISGGSVSSAPLGDSGQLQIGTRVFSVCGRDSQNPLSSGQVSGIRGDGLIQTSIPLGPSSGCALLNAQGEVVGIAVTGVPGAPNRNFVVPINWAKNHIANGAITSLRDLAERNTVADALIRSTLSVPARQRQSWSFVVDADRMANPELVGSFNSTGGLGGQVRFLVVTGENQELYDSGRTTGEAVRVSLPPGKCMLVLDNSESLVFARNVTADFSLHYVR